jgi:hypothetical protein
MTTPADPVKEVEEDLESGENDALLSATGQSFKFEG